MAPNRSSSSRMAGTKTTGRTWPGRCRRRCRPARARHTAGPTGPGERRGLPSRPPSPQAEPTSRGPGRQGRQFAMPAGRTFSTVLLCRARSAAGTVRWLVRGSCGPDFTRPGSAVAMTFRERSHGERAGRSGGELHCHHLVVDHVVVAGVHAPPVGAFPQRGVQGLRGEFVDHHTERPVVLATGELVAVVALGGVWAAGFHRAVQATVSSADGLVLRAEVRGVRSWRRLPAAGRARTAASPGRGRTSPSAWTSPRPRDASCPVRTSDDFALLL